jgi:hypothetical protein
MQHRVRYAKCLFLSSALTASSLTGCTGISTRYTLRRVDNTAVLFPPHSSLPEPNPTASAEVKKARQNSTAVDCDLNGKMVTLHCNRSTALLEFKTDSYLAEPKELGTSSDRTLGMPLGLNVDPFREIGVFQAQLLQLEGRGCLKPAEAQRILRAVPEDFPLPPPFAFHFQLGNFDTNGYFDLTPDFRMEVISPIYDSEDAQTLDHQTGYEVSYYGFKAVDPDGRLLSSFTSAGESRLGQPVQSKPAPRSKIAFPAGPSFYRLLFKFEKAADKQITHAFLLTAAAHSDLDVTTTRIMAPAVYQCVAPLPPMANCMEFPQLFGVNPELRVRVNGKDTYLALGAGVGSALQLPFEAEVPKTLHITRLYRGRRIPISFDPANKDILLLTLLPGDELTW